MVHSSEDDEEDVDASNISVGKSNADALKKLEEDTLISVFKGVHTFEIEKSDIDNGIKAADLLAEKVKVFPSKGELRKLVQGGGVSIHTHKLASPEETIDARYLLNDKDIIVEQCKTHYFILFATSFLN